MTHFSFFQYGALSISFLLIFLSIHLFFIGKEKLSLLFLVAASFFIRFFISTVDPFLHDWDERFHALVAKNMITNPFKPMLYANPVLPYSYKEWCCNHVWVHKQPLFLWQMALSMNLFGVNEVALRLPSVIMGTTQVYFIFRIGKLLKNSSAGFFSALFFALAFYPLQLIAGVADMDQIRVAFGFYVCASIWTFAEYYNTQKTYWVLLTGLFAGCAVLNMWLPGLIVYGAWGIALLFKVKFNAHTLFTNQFREVLMMLLSLAVAIIIFLPWQIYIYHAFPLESTYESQWNSRHITEALEGHSGPWYYYILELPSQFGKVFSLLIPIALFAMLKYSKSRLLLFALLFTLIIPYLFFSFIVQTRMPSYVYMSHFVIWIALGFMFSEIISALSFLKKIKFNSWLFSIATFLVCILFVLKIDDVLNENLLKTIVGNEDGYIERKIYNTNIYRKLDSIVSPHYVVFNCKSNENIEAMFYSSIMVYSWYPNQQQFDSLKSNHIKIAAFKNHNEYQLPEYILSDTSVLIINELLK